ncbi:MAG: hypothetical protein ACLSDJ_06635 [Butyricimonas faecihominis]
MSTMKHLSCREDVPGDEVANLNAANAAMARRLQRGCPLLDKLRRQRSG